MNILRTVLSLLGVTVGIFAIITVFTLVDSLEKNIKASFSFLGSDILYVSKQPFIIKSRNEWLSYRNRPWPSYQDFQAIQKNSQKITGISIFAQSSGVTAKKGNNSFNEVDFIGVSNGYKDVTELEIIQGRYFSPAEVDAGQNVVILGNEVKEALFPNDPYPISKEIKIKGKKYVVIGVMKKEGESFLGFSSKDANCIVPYDSFRQLFNTGSGNSDQVGSTIILTGEETDLGLFELEGEVTGILRSARGLRPSEEDNFTLNRPEALAQAVEGLFDVLSIAGSVIGGFSILIGGFGIANIMFVTVKERTNIIGIQKSLGAKNYFILFQFLFEAIFLSVIGGLAGLLLVVGVTYIPMGSLEVTLSLKNIVLGLGVSIIIGTVSGIIPAALAARLDPVIAIRA